MKLPDGSYYIPGSGTSGTATRLFSYPGNSAKTNISPMSTDIVTPKNTLQMKFMYSTDPYTYHG